MIDTKECCGNPFRCKGKCMSNKMTEREALKLALEALTDGDHWEKQEAITAIKEVLAQPEQEHKCNPHPKTPYKQGWDDGVMAERQRIVNLLMIQHEAAKGSHNYWHVAANLIKAESGENA